MTLEQLGEQRWPYGEFCFDPSARCIHLEFNERLPHGPHNVRNVLATHILKRTESYEQASYAIQDTPDMVAQH